MGNRQLRASLTLILAVFSAWPSNVHCAAAKKKPSAQSKKPASKPISATERLATAIVANKWSEGETLVSACNRAKPIALIEALSQNSDWMARPKGEFETSAEFEQKATKLNDALGTAGRLIACENFSEANALKYDSDKGTFSGYVPTEITAHHVKENLAEYRTKTRMGVPFTVYPSVSVSWVLSVKGNFDRKCFSDLYSNGFSFQYPIDKARALKFNGRWVILGDLRRPYFASEDYNQVASLNDPYPTSSRTLTGYMLPKKIAIIDDAGLEVWSCLTV